MRSSPDGFPLARGGGRSRTTLRLGFIDLIDAAPLIVAFEQGFFTDEDLCVVLERQLGWGNIRDRLTFGELDAAHALVGMPLFSRMGRDWFIEPLVALMNLGSGGNAITLSRRLIDARVRSAATLAEYIRNDPRGEVMVFGHVFSCSMHHYLLREWLASAAIDPDRDVRLRVFPPNQMAGHMARGYVDGFCVGEPWNTLAAHHGAGEVVGVTTDILPGHPEKVLAVSERWLGANERLLVPMIRAVLRGCAWCENEANHPELARMLAAPTYLNTPAELLGRSLRIDHATLKVNAPAAAVRKTDWRARSFSTGCTFPSKTHYAWLAGQMRRWRQLPGDVDALSAARQCADSTAYRAAAASLGIACPLSDSPPMKLHDGVFDPFADAVCEHLVAEGASR